jgi:hypothetical protein
MGQVDHSAMTTCDGPMKYCSGSGTCATDKKPNGQACSASSDCGSGNFCVDQCAATTPASGRAWRATSPAMKAPAPSPPRAVRI